MIRRTGVLRGFTDAVTGASVWRSVPFAAPPVGDLRWRAPRPPAPWSGVRTATAEAPWCPQLLSALDGVGQDQWGKLVGQEDCLYLNIYAPPMTADAAKTAHLPVMMWIHGGSNVWGRAAQYDGWRTRRCAKAPRRRTMHRRTSRCLITSARSNGFATTSLRSGAILVE